MVPMIDEAVIALGIAVSETKFSQEELEAL